MNNKKLINQFESGDIKAMARIISIVENELEGYQNILSSLQIKNVPVIGFTGPPGSGKSTLINSLLSYLAKKNKRIGVIAIDPTSPFNFGSLLGDRLRMSEHFSNENIFIRSLATRGSLGGLSAKTIEIVDVMKAFSTPTTSQPSKKGKEACVRLSPFGGVGGDGSFDYIFIETVGVGQSEVEVAGLADTTVLVLAPGFGDEVQTIKSGIMEIGDIFVVNKSDNAGADGFAKTIEQLIQGRSHSSLIPSSTEQIRSSSLVPRPSSLSWIPPVLKMIATQNEGIEQLAKKIDEHTVLTPKEKNIFLLTEKAYKLIQNNRMKDLDKKKLQKEIEEEMKRKNFNLYKSVRAYY